VTHPAASLAIDERIAHLGALAALVSVASSIAEDALAIIQLLVDALLVDRAALDIDACTAAPAITMVCDGRSGTLAHRIIIGIIIGSRARAAHAKRLAEAARAQSSRIVRPIVDR